MILMKLLMAVLMAVMRTDGGDGNDK